MVVFRSSTWLIRYYFEFQTFHIPLYSHFLSVELGWLVLCSLPCQYWWQHSNAQDTSGEGFSPDPFLCSQNSLESRLHEHESYYPRLNQPMPVLAWINCFSVLCRGNVRSGYTNFCEIANFYRVEDAYHQPCSVWMMTSTQLFSCKNKSHVCPFWLMPWHNLSCEVCQLPQTKWCR